MRPPRARSGIVFLMALLLAAGPIRANSYAWGALTEIPQAEDVFAFAANPLPKQLASAESSQPVRFFTEADLKRYLRDGKPNPKLDYGTSTSGTYRTGVFFTQAGVAYFWTVNGPHLSLLSNGKHCTLSVDDAGASAPAQRFPEFKQPTPPRAADLRDFVSGPPPGDGLALAMTRTQVRRFLEEGRPVYFDTASDVMNFADTQTLTLPAMEGRLIRDLKEWGTALPGGHLRIGRGFLHICGAISTKKGEVFFCELLGDRAMRFQNAAGEEFILQRPDTSQPILLPP